MRIHEEVGTRRMRSKDYVGIRGLYKAFGRSYASGRRLLIRHMGAFVKCVHFMVIRRTRRTPNLTPSAEHLAQLKSMEINLLLLQIKPMATFSSCMHSRTYTARKEQAGSELTAVASGFLLHVG
jgi:hypothetical protein